jgi:putative membrane protein
MKHLLRIYLIHLFAIWLDTLVFSTSFIIANIKVLLIAALILALLNLILKPILKLLFFPINLMTLGLFSLIINMAIFYLLLYLIPEVKILPWTFPGLNFSQFSLPAFRFEFWSTLLVISTFSSFVTNFIVALIK